MGIKQPDRTMKVKRNHKHVVIPPVNLCVKQTRGKHRKDFSPTNIQEMYHFERVSERGDKEFGRLFSESSRTTYGNPEASAGLLMETLKIYPMGTWSKLQKRAFASLFHGTTRGAYWANVLLNHFDDFTVIEFAECAINDTSRFSDQTQELGRNMILSVSVSRAA